VPTLFRRKPAAEVVEPTPEGGDETSESRSKAYTPSKRERGVVTPKRGSTQPRRAAGASRPANRREASAQSRAERIKRRREDREAMMRGEEYALLPRDRGPEKRLVRDIVDSRRNVGTYFFATVFIIMLLTFVSVQAALYCNLVFALLLLLVVIDSVLLSRRVRRLVSERLPKSTPRWGSLYAYGAMRALTFRGMRVPKPQHKPGDPI
jgi:Protein of unknown function (DUF3043)